MLNVTVTIDDTSDSRAVRVDGEVGAHNATEFSHLVGQLTAAVGAARVDLTELTVLDVEGRAAVRTLVRDTEASSGTVRYPAAWDEPPADADQFIG